MSADTGYRPDIDGMRAIAVAAVLVYHAFPRWAPGGFAGVDVFFVISGYLITLVVLNDLRQNTFSLVRFYGRRVRRIFPALAMMLAAVAFLGWLLLLENQFQYLGKHIAGGAAFWSNFLLRNETGYFDLQASQKPLLHLWSLAIEEQFYIVWPLLLYAAWKMRLSLIWSLLFVSLVSFGINVRTLASAPESAFFLPFDRAWELSIGGLLAVARSAHPARVIAAVPGMASAAMAGVGIACVLCSFILLDARQNYPGVRALVPVAGAALLIWAGPDAWLQRKILSHRALAACGLISFPLYLWHWPLLSLDRIIRSDETPAVVRAMLLLVSAGLAFLTYRFVERPIRFGKQSAFKAVLLCLIMGTLGVTGWAASIGMIAARSKYSGADKEIDAATRDWDFPGADLEPFRFQGRRFWRTPTGSNGMISRREVLYFGDSHIEQYAPRVSWLAARARGKYPRVVLATQGNCPPLRDFKAAKPNPDCEGFWDDAMAYGKNPAVSTVVVGASWDHYLEGYEFHYTGPSDPYQELEEMLAGLRQSGKQVYLILKTPTGLAMDPAALVARQFDVFHWKLDFLMAGNGIRIDDLDKKPATKTSLLKQAGLRAGVEIIDPVAYLCSAGVCPAAQENGEPRYHDAYHLRSSFVKENVTFLDRTLTGGHIAPAGVGNR